MPDSSLRRLASMGNPNEAGNWIIASLEEAEYSVTEGRQDPGWFHPSALSNPCDAFLAFRFLGAPAVEVIEPRTRRIFDNGTGRDSFLKEDMRRSGISVITCEEDRKIEIPQLRIRGELDDLVKHPRTGQLIVIDYKTMREDLWKELLVVKADHHIQAHPYMFAKQTPKAFFIYENKNTQEFKIKKADWDPAIWEEICQRIYRILQGLDNNYVTRTPGNCNRCPFNSNGVCVQNDIAGLKARSGLWPGTSSTQSSTNTPTPSVSSPSVSSVTTAESSTPRTQRWI